MNRGAAMLGRTRSLPPEGVGVSTPAMRTLDPVPSTRSSTTVDVVTQLPGPDEVGAVAVPVAEGSDPPGDLGVSPGDFARAVTEGVLLARWRFRISESDDEQVLERLVLVTPARHSEAVVAG